ncbi:protein phosphatase methylesterase 1-like [Saccostrea cucullata]|uniref:protein phosphatase methylesterase 1-like n=1 Tax=Saccostrea cuccullata TaxID=36930 RepID=UPI002ED64422
MSALERQALKASIGGLPPMPPPGLGGPKKRALIRKRDYTPIHWDKYFERMHDVKCGDSDTFRVYECGSSGPVLFFLHGGGFSALSWSLLCSSLSGMVTCRCAAVDLRGHGDSKTSDDQNLSAERLSSDVGNIFKEMYRDDPPPVLLVGHSMGGAIAIHTAFRKLIPSLIGLVVIDVVEGTAMDALSSMHNFLKGRPSVFKSLEQGIEWCVRSGQVRNIESARVSMVGQLKRVETEETATAELEHEFEASSHPQGTSTIIEEEEDESNANKSTSEPQTAEENANSTPTTETKPEFKKPESKDQKEDDHHYTWRIDLGKTSPFWKGWFEGLSNKFLSCDVPKMLLLAGVDRLDKDLTIGQMQGKFQMQVLPQCGHAVHEDSPEKVAEALATFLVRYKVAQPTADFHRVFPAC